MSFENQVLLDTGVIKRLYNTVARGIRSWIYFKKHFLEHEGNRAKLTSLPHLDCDDFAQQVQILAPLVKWGPSECRNSKGLSRSTTANNRKDLLHFIYPFYVSLLSPASPIYVATSKFSGLGLFIREPGAGEATKLLLPKFLWGYFVEMDAETGFAGHCWLPFSYVSKSKFYWVFDWSCLHLQPPLHQLQLNFQRSQSCG
jgi:hypothetical protein